jgi:hypothetical protein
VTHQLQKISGITALLHALIARILGERKLAGGFTVEDINVTQVFILRYKCMAALKEYHWDAKNNTYGNLLIRIGEDDYIGGDTFMDHGRACFSLQKNQAAVWTTYNEDGQLAGEAVHAAGTVYSGEKLVVAALWTLKGFRRPADIAAQVGVITQKSHKAVRDRPCKFN